MKKIFVASFLLNILFACKETPEKKSALPPIEIADEVKESIEEPTNSTSLEEKPAPADEERIDLEKEGSHLVWEQKVAANSAKNFVFSAKAGQLLLLSFADDTDKGSMDFGKISVEPNGDGIEYVIEVTKDYRFTVTNNSGASTSFRIYLSVTNPDYIKSIF